MHQDLEQAIEFHDAIIAEGGKALVGYETAKALANVVLLSEIPTTYDKKQNRQVNAGNLLLRGVPGVGKTFFGVILAAISGARFARIQGRADLQPTEVVGFQMINSATGVLITEFGPLASGEIVLLDEINRIPLKSQSAPSWCRSISSRLRLNALMPKERIIELRSAISEHVFLHERLGTYIHQFVAATRPHNPDTDWFRHSPSSAGAASPRCGPCSSRENRRGM